MADFNFVTVRVATGAALTSAADVDQLAAAGVTHVIDCRAEFDDAPLFAAGGLAYLWDGVPDDAQPKPAAWFATALEFGLPALARPRTRLLCHCAAGRHRGPSMAYAFMRAAGWPAALAEQTITAARPGAELIYRTDADAACAQLGYI